MKIEITTASGDMLTINVTDAGVEYTRKPLSGGAAALPEVEESLLDCLAEEFLNVVRAQARQERRKMAEGAASMVSTLCELVVA